MTSNPITFIHRWEHLAVIFTNIHESTPVTSIWKHPSHFFNGSPTWGRGGGVGLIPYKIWYSWICQHPEILHLFCWLLHTGLIKNPPAGKGTLLLLTTIPIPLSNAIKRAALHVQCSLFHILVVVNCVVYCCRLFMCCRLMCYGVWAIQVISVVLSVMVLLLQSCIVWSSQML